MLLASIHKTTYKKTIFEWGPEQQQAMSKMQKLVSQSMALGLQDPHSDMIWKCLQLTFMQTVAYGKIQ